MILEWDDQDDIATERLRMLETPLIEKMRDYYSKMFKFLTHSDEQIEMALTLYKTSLKAKLSGFSKKSERIVLKKSKKEACNFKAIQIMFNALKKEYDGWFFKLVDIFQGIEESIVNIEKFQWEIKDEFEEL